MHDCNDHLILIFPNFLFKVRSCKLIMASIIGGSNSASTGVTIDKDNNSDEGTVQSFVDALPSHDRDTLILDLKSFADRHAYQHRPIAVVTSGGTVADLEVQSVRCIDNFSTGQRGAIAVEEFLKRGYAVIHLCRRGSASPYGRVLSNSIMSSSSTPNQGITIGSLGKLFSTGDVEENQEDQLVQEVLDAQNNRKQFHKNSTKRSTGNKSYLKGGIKLHRRIINSVSLRSALIERRSALEEYRLLTVSFRSVEEYLAKLRLSSDALKDSQALAMFFLCAAVSDFYVPISERSNHKIQSRDVLKHMPNNDTLFSKDTENNCLKLKLWPVPKVMGLLRRQWAPDAFVCSFKLETEKELLRKKAEGAVEKYGCHMVIGNLLKTRHDEVWILAPSSMSDGANSKVQDWLLQKISKPKSSESPDRLEVMIMEHVVQAHFEYISTCLNGNLDKSGTNSVLRAHLELEKKKRGVEKELFWYEFKKVALDWAGIIAGAAISFAISTALKRRLNT